MEPEIVSSGVGHKEKRKRLSLPRQANGDGVGLLLTPHPVA